MKLKPNKLNKVTRGFTLMEVLLVIAVGAGLIIASIVFYQQADGGSKLTQAFQQVQSTVSGVRQLYSSRSSYGTIDLTETAVDNNVFPSSMLDVNGDPRNPWGGEVGIEGSGTTFTITLPDVPRDACGKLISQNASGFGGGLISLEVNGTAATSTNIDPVAATALCDEVDANEIIWELR